MEIRPLATIGEFRQVFALEMQVWGYSDAQDAVAVPILAVTVRNGGILIGAYEGRELVAFAYSLAGIKHGKPIQWSHMLGVREDHRGAGIGTLLKLEQRKRAMEMGLDTIQWTFDPLQAVNAYLNLHRLGATVEEYEEDAYGESSSPLHRGTPTDRFIANWQIRSVHVERCLELGNERRAVRGGRTSHAVRDAAVGEAPRVNSAVPQGEWLAPGDPDLELAAPQLLVEIPIGFSEMQSRFPGVARRWRAVTREIFTHYFARGYCAVDFRLDRENRRGTYLLTSQPTAE